MPRGVHGEKIVAAKLSDKVPQSDIARLESALAVYDEWICNLNRVGDDPELSLDDTIIQMVQLLTDYKYYIDVNLIFDSQEDFLYRQKGQLKLDNTVMEEFLPIFVEKCLVKKFGECNLTIDSQTHIFSSVYFASSLNSPAIGGGISLKTKNHDFAMSRTLYIKASYNNTFRDMDTVSLTAHLGYTLAELKTNLDKTMFQEASATAHDAKIAVTGAKYYLLCDFLDMTPISTTTTDIDEILITRKAKRINSNIRKLYSSYSGRQSGRADYINYLTEHPYDPDIFKRFLNHIISQMQNEELIENSVLNTGYF